MPTIVACKLPHGLTINHAGQIINLNGSNADFNPEAPAGNGVIVDNAVISGGFGLTTLDDKQAEAFADWCNRAQFKDGDKANGLLDEPFLPLTNGAIQSYKSESDARKDTRAVTSSVSTGFDGLDGDAEMRRATAGSPDLVKSGADK